MENQTCPTCRKEHTGYCPQIFPHVLDEIRPVGRPAGTKNTPGHKAGGDRRSKPASDIRSRRISIPVTEAEYEEIKLLIKLLIKTYRYGH